ncbi:IclR family transcriptional regulator [Pseudonocardia sp. CA-107938]|uniref:IclR family transcriptional regulator n=1 Tax=Pseudonocardia sp. CA-107938 TaxID=3240021 RepID=UPI003D94736A
MPEAEKSSVARIAAVLRAIATEDGPGGMSGSDVARLVGRERSQVSRMLKALADTGLVEQNHETKAYRLGWQLFTLAARAGDHRLVGAGAAVARAVVAETGETALLSVLVGNRSHTVLAHRPERVVQAGGWIGRTSPLHAAASGRALILDMADQEVAELVAPGIGADGLGSKALPSVERVLEVLAREREVGYCVAVDELEDGLASIGVPVRDATQRIVGSLNVSGPSFRVVDRLDALAATARLAARRLSSAISGGTGTRS